MSWIRDGRRRERRPRPIDPGLPPPVALPEPQPPDGMPVVAYKHNECLQCGSLSTRVYSKRKRVRYHECRDCGYRFKSLEPSP